MNLALVMLVASVVLLLAGALVLRSIGSGLHIGRLLSGTRLVPIDEALEIATSGEERYVRVSGRMSSDEEFPDDQNRPLVFRRTRIEIGAPADQWTTILDEREAVTFGVEARSAYIGVDDVALGEGVVVITRVSTGTVAELPADMAAEIPAGIDPQTAARLTIDQLSAVEHATVVGLPTMQGGRAVMTHGNGKPLIVTTLDQPAAMRVLATGRRGRVVVGAVMLSAGLGLLAGALIAFLTGA